MWCTRNQFSHKYAESTNLALVYVESTVFCSQGEVEEELKAMDFQSLFIYRPA